MSPLSQRMFVFPFLLLLACNSIAESVDPLGRFCNLDLKISTSSRVSANIGLLLSQLVSKTKSDGFVATSYGEKKDKVYGLAQCRGDVSSKDCSSCIQDAAKQIRQLCPNKADARLWYHYCFLRYSLEDFVGKVDTSFGLFDYNVKNVTDPKTFYLELGALTDRIEPQAFKPKNRGLGKGKSKVSPFITLYALVQCTRDLAPVNCAQCLATAVGNFPNFCENRKGCWISYSNCYARYELYPFYFPLDANNTRAESPMSVMRVVSP